MGKANTMFVFSLLVFNHACKAHATCEVYHDASGRTLADCSKRQLNTVPLHLPRNTESLNLESNYLTELKDNTFSLYSCLTVLNLSSNRISKLEPRAFNGLWNLSSLDISNNYLHVNTETYPDGIFGHLWDLQVLMLRPVMKEYSYGKFPSNTFEHLVNLKHLQLSYWPNPNQSLFFQHLKSLKSLSLLNTDDWYGGMLSNSTFLTLKSTPLTNLVFSAEIDYLDENIFSPLSQLNSLLLTNDFNERLTLKKAMRSLKSFSGRNMTTINLRGIQDTRWRIGSNDEITRTMMLYVSEICVDNLDLSCNKLRIFRTDAVFSSTFFNCLKSVDLTENPIHGDTAIVFKLQIFTNLQVVKFGELQRLDTIAETRRKGMRLTLFTPPMLERFELYAAGHNNIHGDVLLLNTTNLHTLDLSHNGLIYIQGYVKGLCHVRRLYLSHGLFHPSTFENTDIRSSIEELYADYTTFGLHFLTSKTFLDIPHLQILDLSGQGLFHIARNTFTSFTKLELLVLSDNTFTFIPEEIYSMQRLKHLDLSFNALSSLSTEDMHAFDNIIENRDGFNLHLNGNTFVCSCFSLGFIEWLQTTKVNLDHGGNYSCLTNEGLASSTGLFNIHYEYHWRKCIGQRWFTVSIGLFLLQIISIISAFLLKKYSPKIEYFLLNTFGYSSTEPPKRKDFMFDAYIIYESSEYQWPCLCLFSRLQERENNIRLYLPDLHEPFGWPKADAIIEALSDSWKAVIVISERTFEFTDEWTYFTIISAVRLFSAHNDITGRIILLYKDVSPQVKARVPLMLLNVVPEEHIIDVSDGVEFWSTLRQLIMEENASAIAF